MSKVRQMPQLYLRGSLANLTMKNLNEDQKKHIEGLVLKVASHRDMQRHKIEIMQKLGVTIAADYADDRLAAEEEFHIAIWRGVCDLFYHHKYTFECKACKSSVYMTKRQQPKAIDRIQMPCPNCHCVEIADPGDVAQLQDLIAAGTPYITQDAFQMAYRDLPDGFTAPKAKPSIVAIAGARKYENPQAIIDDDEQLRKFFGEFVWNYFRQQINENKRKEHRRTETVRGPADQVILQEVLSLCSCLGISYNHCDKTTPVNGHYAVLIDGLKTPPRLTAELALLKAKANLHKIPMVITSQAVMIKICVDAPEIVAEVIKPEHVTILDNLTSSSDEEAGDFALSQVSHRTVAGERMDSENHVDTIDNYDAFAAARESLPDGHCRDIFDIYSGVGDKYIAFSEEYGDGEPKVNNISAFLGITARTVKTYKEMLKMQLLAKELVPN